MPSQPLMRGMPVATRLRNRKASYCVTLGGIEPYVLELSRCREQTSKAIAQFTVTFPRNAQPPCRERCIRLPSYSALPVLYQRCEVRRQFP